MAVGMPVSKAVASVPSPKRSPRTLGGQQASQVIRARRSQRGRATGQGLPVRARQPGHPVAPHALCVHSSRGPAAVMSGLVEFAVGAFVCRI